MSKEVATDDDVDVPGIMDLLSVMNNRALKMHFSVIAPNELHGLRKDWYCFDDGSEY